MFIKKYTTNYKLNSKYNSKYNYDFFVHTVEVKINQQSLLINIKIQSVFC